MKTDSPIYRYLGFHATGDLGPYTFYTSRRRGLVWFVKSPPLEPPSPLQSHHRNRFKVCGYLWRAMSQAHRDRWRSAQARAHLSITGHNLFYYYISTMDRDAITTVERIAHLKLLPLEWA